MLGGRARRGGRARARRRAPSSRAATRSATPSRSTGSPWSARSTRTAIWPKAGARPGDALFLTKPLGTGIVLQAVRDGNAPAARSTRRRVDDRAEPRRGRRAAAVRPNAVTDVTGFGLSGTPTRSRPGAASASSSRPSALPALPGALELAEAAAVTGGDRRNREFADRTSRALAERARGARLRPADGRRAPRLAPAERGPVLEATIDLPGLASREIGSVEDGAGVVLR